MTKAKLTARRFRWVLLVLGIGYTLLALVWMLVPYASEYLDANYAGLFGTPLSPWEDISEWGYAVNLVLVVGLILLAQWAFLRPGRVWTARLTVKGRPLKSAVIAAAALAMLLTIGAFALLLDLAGHLGFPDTWGWLMNDDSTRTASASGEPEWGLWFWLLVLGVWAFWAWVFFVYWRQGDRYTQLGRMIRALIAGSLVEAFVAIPAHIWTSRPRDCYCERNTYTTLVFCGTVLLWAFGPGIVLLFLHEHYRRMRLFPRCLNCGYQLTGNTSGICPECGEPIEQTPNTDTAR